MFFFSSHCWMTKGCIFYDVLRSSLSWGGISSRMEFDSKLFKWFHDLNSKLRSEKKSCKALSQALSAGGRPEWHPAYPAGSRSSPLVVKTVYILVPITSITLKWLLLPDGMFMPKFWYCSFWLIAESIGWVNPAIVGCWMFNQEMVCFDPST